ncbi:hypothetical protein NADFUDRAFT_64551 [Nadsonia fulvescens var. elongata DSM 6958]|uniref:BBC1/AIM3 cysteine proteinase-fold domain-containing protein n=1 Tax=Nadsonia fulvescens var. elongata DSM 6958 TaxID=857566 RepID=A0A1E3PQ46_9ASCO|nr:hypothetical protein NADFUDRAFT_64551 [Nadsonia fulvescens var. elongata DSM 6958]
MSGFSSYLKQGQEKLSEISKKGSEHAKNHQSSSGNGGTFSSLGGGLREKFNNSSLNPHQNTQQNDVPETVVARPLSALKNPNSFPPPPKHKEWYGETTDGQAALSHRQSSEQHQFYPPQPQASAYPPQSQASAYPPQPQAPAYPPQPLTSAYPPQPQASAYPPQPQAPAYPPQPQAPAYPPQPQAPAYPPQPQIHAYPPQSQTSAYSSQPQIHAYPPQPQASTYPPQPQAFTYSSQPQAPGSSQALDSISSGSYANSPASDVSSFISGNATPAKEKYNFGVVIHDEDEVKVKKEIPDPKSFPAPPRFSGVGFNGSQSSTPRASPPVLVPSSGSSAGAVPKIPSRNPSVTGRREKISAAVPAMNASLPQATSFPEPPKSFHDGSVSKTTSYNRPEKNTSNSTSFNKYTPPMAQEAAKGTSPVRAALPDPKSFQPPLRHGSKLSGIESTAQFTDGVNAISPPSYSRESPVSTPVSGNAGIPPPIPSSARPTLPDNTGPPLPVRNFSTSSVNKYVTPISNTSSQSSLNANVKTKVPPPIVPNKPKPVTISTPDAFQYFPPSSPEQPRAPLARELEGKDSLSSIPFLQHNFAQEIKLRKAGVNSQVVNPNISRVSSGSSISPETINIQAQAKKKAPPPTPKKKPELKAKASSGQLSYHSLNTATNDLTKNGHHNLHTPVSPLPAINLSTKPQLKSIPALTSGTLPGMSTPKTIDFELSSGWFTEVTSGNLMLPRQLQNINYASSYQCQPQGSNIIMKAFFAFRISEDLSVVKIKLEWNSQDPIGTVKLERKDIPPPSNTLPYDELLNFHQCFGERVASWAEAKKNTQVGDGECWTLAKQSIQETCQGAAMVSQGYTHGYLVQHLSDKRTIAAFDSVRRGDILQFTNAKFQSRSANGRFLTKLVGAPNHTSVVTGISSSGNLVYVVEQNTNNSKVVKDGYYNLQELDSGDLKVYRVASIDWAGRLDASWS